MVNGMPVEGMVRKVVTRQTPLSRHMGRMSHLREGPGGEGGGERGMRC